MARPGGRARQKKRTALQTWEKVRERYIRAYDKGPNLVWYAMVGHYVARCWLEEDKLLQGRPYDANLTDPVWDGLSLADLEALDEAALKLVERDVAHIAANEGLRLALREETRLSLRGVWLTARDAVIGTLGVAVFGLLVIGLSGLFNAKANDAMSELTGTQWLRLYSTASEPGETGSSANAS